jgi:hypothetical protein
VLVPLSGGGDNQDPEVPYAAWVCINPKCLFFIKNDASAAHILIAVNGKRLG